MLKHMLWRESPSPALRERVASAASRVRVFQFLFRPSPSHRCAMGPSLSRSAGEGLFATLLALFLLLFPLQSNAALLETPMFTEAVAKGTLPAIDERVPRAPALAELETLGRPGAYLCMLMS